MDFAHLTITWAPGGAKYDVTPGKVTGRVKLEGRRGGQVRETKESKIGEEEDGFVNEARGENVTSFDQVEKDRDGELALNLGV